MGVIQSLIEQITSRVVASHPDIHAGNHKIAMNLQIMGKHKNLFSTLKTLQTTGMNLNQLKNNPTVLKNKELLKLINQILKYSDAGIVLGVLKNVNPENNKENYYGPSM